MLQASALPMESLVVGLTPDGNWRGLRNIFDDVTPDMGWSYFADVYAELGEVSLGGVDWDAILNTLWWEVMQRHHLDVGPMYRLDAWEEVLRVCGLLDEDGFLRRIVDWGAADDNVERWLHGDRPISRNTADLGGWLADYVNTLYQKRRGGVRDRVKYMAIHNGIYRSVFHKFGFALTPSANTAGNIFEHLCWHAFEHHREELVLAIVWHTAKEARDQQSNASLSGTDASRPGSTPSSSGAQASSSVPASSSGAQASNSVQASSSGAQASNSVQAPISGAQASSPSQASSLPEAQSMFQWTEMHEAMDFANIEKASAVFKHTDARKMAETRAPSDHYWRMSLPIHILANRGWNSEADPRPFLLKLYLILCQNMGGTPVSLLQ